MDQALDSSFLNTETKKKLKYASYGKRVGAALIYLVIVIAMMITINIISSSFIDFTAFQGDSADFEFYLYLSLALRAISIVAFVFYYTLMESSKKQATLGKRAVGIYVGNTEGEKINFGFSLLRIISKLIWWIVAIVCLYFNFPLGIILIICIILSLIALLMPLWRDDCQALHDRICRTYVYQN